jgi:OmpA-OmpF porin, OOP family
MMRTALTFAVALMLFPAAWAQQDLRDTLFVGADRARAAAISADAALLAPTAFGRGESAYANAESDLARGRNMDRIRSQLTAAADAYNEASGAAEIATVTLASLIKTRDDALAANAQTFASAEWAQAESEFNTTARRLESGDLRGARQRAERAEALFRDAELNAIKTQYLSQTRALLAQARDQRVPRLAPLTFARAEALLQQAERELSENRYDTDLPRSLAQEANYQARHAIFLAGEIQRIRDRGLSVEEIILAYEDPLTQIAAAADIVAALDRGVEPVVTELVRYIEDLRELHEESANDLGLARMRIGELEEELRSLDERLGGMSQERVALVQRIEADARVRQQFATIEDMFTRDEARASREGNTVVLRMVGLTFASGSASVDAAHRALLEKVRRAMDVFPRSQIVIEGHTDSHGSDEANMVLSRRRAEAVSEYLSSELAVPAFRISAIGYGETRPIASNETAQGRERNRRIDIRIEPQLD